MKKLNRKGFTLIEILVVVAIIGILAGVVLVGLRGTGPQARDSRRAADLKQVQNGLELYYNKNNRYPAAADWTALKTALTAGNLGIRNIPQDPTNNATYRYEYYTDANGTTYLLKATLEEAGSKLTQGDIDGSVSIGAGNIACGTDGAAEIEYCVQL